MREPLFITVYDTGVYDTEKTPRVKSGLAE